MSDNLVPTGDEGPLVSASTGGMSLSSPRRVAGLGHQQLTYGVPETVTWKHVPGEVLADLRLNGLAPQRIDAGSAGDSLTKRRPTGSYYRRRLAWYVGLDLNDREVLVQIDARQELRELATDVRRFSPNGGWSATTAAWNLGERKRLTWKFFREESHKDEASKSSELATQVQMIPMSATFIQRLRGLPDDIQMAVFEAIDFSARPWGEIQAWGYSGCDTACSHVGPCEQFVMAVLSDSTMVSLNMNRERSGWNGWVMRSNATPLSDRDLKDSQIKSAGAEELHK